MPIIAIFNPISPLNKPIIPFSLCIFNAGI